MRKLIDWKLFSNDLKIFELNDIFCQYDGDNLSLKDEEGNNFIDIRKRIYKRSTSEYKMIVDFNNSTVNFSFVTGESCCFDIETDFEVTDKKIKLVYKIDDDQKEIVIEFKEEKDENVINQKN